MTQVQASSPPTFFSLGQYFNSQYSLRYSPRFLLASSRAAHQPPPVFSQSPSLCSAHIFSSAGAQVQFCFLAVCFPHLCLAASSCLSSLLSTQISFTTSYLEFLTGMQGYCGLLFVPPLPPYIHGAMHLAKGACDVFVNIIMMEFNHIYMTSQE